MMGTIRISGLEVYAHHGYYGEEQKLGQRFLVSLEIVTDFAACVRGDSLSDTVNYGEAALFAAKMLQETNYRLIEKAADELAKAILLRWERIRRVKVRLEKPSAPIPLSFASVGVEVERGWHEAYLGLGSNLGDREAWLDLALASLRSHREIRGLKESKRIETKPYGYREQPDFLNSCAFLRTILSPEELLDAAQTAENAAHRERLIRWGPRTLDVDLLLYDDLVLGTERLVLPHPEIEKRLFVLEPLNELAPWLRHPVSRRTMRELLEELRVNG